MSLAESFVDVGHAVSFFGFTTKTRRSRKFCSTEVAEVLRRGRGTAPRRSRNHSQ